MKFDIQIILLLSLFSPLVEIFPNLYMSWWTPSNGKLQRYLDTWPRRVLVVFVVWLPILFILARVIEPSVIIWIISAIVFSAFWLRLYVFDQSLKQELEGGNSVAGLYNKIPELLYLVTFSIIGAVLYMSVPDNHWLAPVGVLIIFLGAFIIGTFRRGRHTNLTLDIVGRLIFTTGFLLNLYNLARAVPIIIFHL